MTILYDGYIFTETPTTKAKRLCRRLRSVEPNRAHNIARVCLDLAGNEINDTFNRILLDYVLDAEQEIYSKGLQQ